MGCHMNVSQTARRALLYTPCALSTCTRGRVLEGSEHASERATRLLAPLLRDCKLPITPHQGDTRDKRANRERVEVTRLITQVVQATGSFVSNVLKLMPTTIMSSKASPVGMVFVVGLQLPTVLAQYSRAASSPFRTGATEWRSTLEAQKAPVRSHRQLEACVRVQSLLDCLDDDLDCNYIAARWGKPNPKAMGRKVGSYDGLELTCPSP